MTENKYQMIITWSDEDQAFLVDVPDLPGCKADGKTEVEAVSNANDMMNGLNMQRKTELIFQDLRKKYMYNHIVRTGSYYPVRWLFTMRRTERYKKGLYSSIGSGSP